MVGVAFLGTGALAWALGFATLGMALGAIVAALALLAAATGFCTGCEAYKLGSFLARAARSSPARSRHSPRGSD